MEYEHMYLYIVTTDCEFYNWLMVVMKIFSVMD